MSGGSYDYVTFKIADAAAELIARHPDEPHVVALGAHLKRVAEVMHDIESADSCDTSWNAKLDADIRALLAPGAELTAATEKAERALAQLQAVLAAAPTPERAGTPEETMR